MKIVVAGASGFIGRPLVAALRSAGHEVLRLVRRGETGKDAVSWDPARRSIPGGALAGADGLINLAGENIAGGRWTADRRERILRSRRDATQTLVAALRSLERKPGVLLNASAVGYYGDRGDAWLDEAAGPGKGFLAEVCQAWESDAREAEAAGVRTVCLRFGMVLAADGGALAKMLPLFRLGLGGRLGRGGQWVSWIGRDDAIGIVQQALGDSRASGPINVAAPAPVTNAGLTAALARQLRRPAVIPAPRWALRAVFGAMADETLLASTRAIPRKTEELGYSFRHPTIEQALAAVLSRSHPSSSSR